MPINIPETLSKRIVIVGAGFAGLKFARSMSKSNYQIVLIDKNNFHQFQPLFYQVAMAGLEPSSIAFPLRKAFQGSKNLHIRRAEMQSIDHLNQKLITNVGFVNYDLLVLALGGETNFFGNSQIQNHAFGLKSISESLSLRNQIFIDLERTLLIRESDKRQELLDVVIVGGGPTGVELAGALAEMKKFIIPKDYQELDTSEIDIYLLQAGNRLLPGMSLKAGQAAYEELIKMGVHVQLNSRVTDFDGTTVKVKNGKDILARKLIWAAGISCPSIPGIPTTSIGKCNRILVDKNLKVKGVENIFAIGDLALMYTEDYLQGHPQVAQVAIQQAKYLSKHFILGNSSGFIYKDLGTMATIGRNKAVVDLPKKSFNGFFAWIIWLFVHLNALIGVKNKVFVFINWLWNYLTYDQSLRLIIKPGSKTSEDPIL